MSSALAGTETASARPISALVQPSLPIADLTLTLSADVIAIQLNCAIPFVFSQSPCRWPSICAANFHLSLLRIAPKRAGTGGASLRVTRSGPGLDISRGHLSSPARADQGARALAVSRPRRRRSPTPARPLRRGRAQTRGAAPPRRIQRRSCRRKAPREPENSSYGPAYTSDSGR